MRSRLALLALLAAAPLVGCKSDEAPTSTAAVPAAAPADAGKGASSNAAPPVGMNPNSSYSDNIVGSKAGN